MPLLPACLPLTLLKHVDIIFLDPTHSSIVPLIVILLRTLIILNILPNPPSHSHTRKKDQSIRQVGQKKVSTQPIDGHCRKRNVEGAKESL
mmetsp:Transcript_11109/g.23714  ORF Transcript_11109/g.23714 Transcript_11109/m.23714 type:complete len:91 (-) Transcript_11109:1609-1881(-)